MCIITVFIDVMSEQIEYRKIQVDFTFDARDALTRQPRLERALALLLSCKARDIQSESTTLPNGIEQVILKAFVPKDKVGLHRGFDSILNKSFEFGGCGAGYVSDDNKLYILE